MFASAAGVRACVRLQQGSREKEVHITQVSRFRVCFRVGFGLSNKQNQISERDCQPDQGPRRNRQSTNTANVTSLKKTVKQKEASCRTGFLYGPQHETIGKSSFKKIIE
jgi:hypothetical protein